MILALDGKALVYRVYYASAYRNPDTGVVDGFAGMVKHYREALQPRAWVMAWESGKSFRSSLLPTYKGSRKRTQHTLYGQFAGLLRWCEDNGLPVASVDGFEADDVLASIAAEACRCGEEIVIASDDKDILQLVRTGVRVMRPGQWKKSHALLDSFSVFREWGVCPDTIPDVLALVGDVSDDIPGVPGIGMKTARSLIARNGMLTYLYDHLDAVAPTPRIRNLLRRHEKQVRLAHKLALLRDNLPVGQCWKEVGK